MDAIETLIRRLPGKAERIRRQFWQDAEFRAVCQDYQDAMAAVARLEISDPQRAEEYRQLAAELFAEAKQMLKGGLS